MRRALFATILTAVLSPAAMVAADEPPPNFVIIYCDDLGYADVGCFGAKTYTTPNIDRLARQGMRLTDFHTAAAVCSASRAALLTGCYPQRVGIFGALGPGAKVGIHADEVLLPELLKQRGYATAIFGKWHLGDAPQFLPTRHGFDRYFGLPYSNDMWPNHPTNKNFPPLPLIDGEKVVELMPDQTQLTTWYTQQAVKFIAESKDKPFLLYVPHSMPHVPLFVSDKFKNKSGVGLFGDVIQEIDWSMGEILAALAEHGLTERTLVLFSSDNGPWLSYGNHAGSAGPLREGKGTTWEGSQRVPCIACWLGKIPAASQCRELTSTLDILPTLARLAGGQEPQDRIIDGRDIWPLLSGRVEKFPEPPTFYYYWDYGLDAVRQGPWKLVFPHKYRSLTGTPGRDGRPGGYSEASTDLALYNLDADVGETRNVAAENPQIVEQLQKLAELAREDLGDAHQNRPGKNRRPPGRLVAN
jgi:arylsulfatase A-like enzyme